MKVVKTARGDNDECIVSTMLYFKYGTQLSSHRCSSAFGCIIKTLCCIPFLVTYLHTYIVCEIIYIFALLDRLVVSMYCGCPPGMPTHWHSNLCTFGLLTNSCSRHYILSLKNGKPGLDQGRVEKMMRLIERRYGNE